MGIYKTKEQFILDSKKVHGNLYDYSLVDYKGYKDKVIIICPIHGEFEQKPSLHLSGKKCQFKENGNKKSLEVEEFIKKAIKVHGKAYNYNLVNYRGAFNKIIIICSKHGNFEQSSSNHLQGYGCPKCGIEKASLFKTYTTEEFIEKANKVHNFKFDYKNAKYTKGYKKIEIICPIHGNFWQSPNSHIRGTGCPKCAREYSSLKRNDWVIKSKGKIGIFYIIKCWNDTEIFYKLGITFNSLKKRYSCEKDMPYHFKIIKLVESKDLGYIWDLEKRFKRRKKKQHYLPLIKFAGYFTECFKI